MIFSALKYRIIVVWLAGLGVCWAGFQGFVSDFFSLEKESQELVEQTEPEVIRIPENPQLRRMLPDTLRLERDSLYYQYILPDTLEQQLLEQARQDTSFVYLFFDHLPEMTDFIIALSGLVVPVVYTRRKQKEEQEDDG